MIDYIIVGQGIAGTLVAHQLITRNKKICIIDDGHKSASSAVAAGMINPVTGRKYVKSWMIEKLLISAREIYSKLEANLDIEIQSNNNIIRTLTSIEAENSWMLRMQEEEYNDYISTNPDIGDYEGMINSIPAYGEITQGMRINMSLLIYKFREVHASLFKNENFDFAQLKLDGDMVSYSDIKAKAIIFCDGYKVKDNPYFKYLPSPSKGRSAYH